MEQMYVINFTEKELELICEQLSLKPFGEVANIIGRIQHEYASQRNVVEEVIEEVVEITEE